MMMMTKICCVMAVWGVDDLVRLLAGVEPIHVKLRRLQVDAVGNRREVGACRCLGARHFEVLWTSGLCDRRDSKLCCDLRALLIFPLQFRLRSSKSFSNSLKQHGSNELKCH